MDTAPLPSRLPSGIPALMVKPADTFVFVAMLTRQTPVPAQAPLQPVKVYPGSAAAVRVTVWVEPKLVLQVLPHMMPDGLLTIVPPADALTVRMCVVVPVEVSRISWGFSSPSATVTL